MTDPKPTPTQAEADAHARGERIDEHEPDGSPIQHIAMLPELAVKAVEEAPPPAEEPPPVVEEKAADADKERSTYKTRRAKADEEKKD